MFCVDWITDILAQDVLRGMREAASRGFWVAPMAPYGYRKVTAVPSAYLMCMVFTVVGNLL